MQYVLTEFEQGRGPSGLARSLMNFYKIKKPNELITKVYSAENPQNMLASSAKLICEHAQSGEKQALRLIREMALSLLELFLRALTIVAIGLPQRLALFGGLLAHGSVIRETFLTLMNEREINVHLVEPTLQPAAAAVIHAIQSTGQPVNERLRSKLHALSVV